MPLDIFSKSSIPDILPDEMQKIINEIKESPDKEACLKKAHEILTSKYRGDRIKTYTKLFNVFKQDIALLWNKKGFLYCTNLNYILRTLLIKSGFYSDDEIRLRWTQIWYFTPHQYLQVKVNDNWIDVDIWAYAYGIQLGDHAHGFH